MMLVEQQYKEQVNGLFGDSSKEVLEAESSIVMRKTKTLPQTGWIFDFVNVSIGNKHIVYIDNAMWVT